MEIRLKWMKFVQSLTSINAGFSSMSVLAYSAVCLHWHIHPISNSVDFWFFILRGWEVFYKGYFFPHILHNKEEMLAMMWKKATWWKQPREITLDWHMLTTHCLPFAINTDATVEQFKCKWSNNKIKVWQNSAKICQIESQQKISIKLIAPVGLVKLNFNNRSQATLHTGIFWINIFNHPRKTIDNKIGKRRYIKVGVEIRFQRWLWICNQLNM